MDNIKSSHVNSVLSQSQMNAIELTLESVLSSMSEAQIYALLYCVQDMINGQTNVLCAAHDMSNEQIRETRGEIRALYEFANVLSRTWQDAVYGGGDDDAMKD